MHRLKHLFSIILTITIFLIGTHTVRADDFFTTPIVINAQGRTATGGGKIDITKNPAKDLSVEFKWSTTKFNNDPDKDPSNYQLVKSKKTLETSSPEGVADDGSYYFKLPDNILTPDKTYYFRQTVFKDTTSINTTIGEFSSTNGIVVTGSKKEQDIFNSKSYHLLAPWPGLSVLMDPDLCAQQKADGVLPEGAVCDVNGFLNFAFKTLIGLTAVFLVIRLMIIGYEYMTTDTPFKKASSKDAFFSSLFGLLLALSAYLILNTINPKLVNNRINIDNVNLSVEEFQLSEAQTSSFSGKPVKINFNKEAYPAAKKASEKTGVDITLILAIFDQETGSGRAGIAGTGRCRINEAKANAYPADKTALAQIASELGRNVNDLPVSCSFQRADGTYNGHGGAVGYAQSLPTTWNAHKGEVKQNLGKTTADPWNIDDALMFIGVFMKNHGGIASPYNGACKYFGQCVFGGVDYAGQVVGRMATFKKEIADKKAKGLLQ